MARTKATQDALADRMAVLIARGSSQADAYRKIKPRSRKYSNQDLASAASHFAAKFNITARVAELRKQMRVQDIYSVQQALEDTIRIRNDALGKDNYNAAQALQRQASQIVGAIGQGQTTLVVAEKLSDAAIIERLAAGSPALAAALAETLGIAPQTQHVDQPPQRIMANPGKALN